MLRQQSMVIRECPLSSADVNFSPRVGGNRFFLRLCLLDLGFSFERAHLGVYVKLSELPSAQEPWRPEDEMHSFQLRLDLRN